VSELAVIDANIFVWAVKKQATAGQEHMIGKAEALLRYCDDNGIKLLIPAPVIVEVMARVTDENDRKKFLDIIYKRFRVAALDDISAMHAGEMWATKPNWKETHSDITVGAKNSFKFDMLVLGIAKQHKVSAVYTNDKQMISIAKAHGLNAIDIETMSFPGKMISLFDQIDEQEKGSNEVEEDEKTGE
jgi:predicted nucleic acid-binding protein